MNMIKEADKIRNKNIKMTKYEEKNNRYKEKVIENSSVKRA